MTKSKTQSEKPERHRQDCEGPSRRDFDDGQQRLSESYTSPDGSLDGASWKEIDRGAGKLEWFVTPKDLDDD